MKRFAALFLTLSMTNNVWAGTFQILGVRALGMGGAQVAAPQGPVAQYWNPAGLGMTTGSGFQVPVTASFEATGNILQKADSIVKLSNEIESIQAKQDSGATITLNEVKAFNDAIVKLNALNQSGTGALVGANGGLNTRLGRFALSANTFAEAGMTPFVDTNVNLGNISGSEGVTLEGDAGLNNGDDTAARDELVGVLDNLVAQFGIQLEGGENTTTAANALINTARQEGLTSDQITTLVNDASALNEQLQNSGINNGGSDSLSDNDTHVLVRGAMVSEVALGYGRPVPFPSFLGELAVGGNAKILRGDVGYTRVDVMSGDEAEAGDAFDDLDRNHKSSVRPAADLGVLWRAPFERNLQVGLLARNINSPTFDQPEVARLAGEPDFKQQAQMRGGVSFDPIKRLTLATDLDLTKNDTPVRGFYSRYWGMGAELRLPVVDLRAGLMRNVAAGTPVTYTMGLGLHIFALKVDVGAAFSSEQVRVEEGEDEVPANAQVGINIGLVFGGGAKAKR